MGRLLEFATAAEKPLRTRFGRWMLEVSKVVDALVAGTINVQDLLLPSQSSPPAAVPGSGVVFTQTVNGIVELFFREDNGVVVQITSNGQTLGGSTAFQSQATWFIDPINGNDANTGLTAATALKTDAQRQFRVGPIWTIKSDTTVTYLNDVSASDPCIFTYILGLNGVLRITGVATTTYTSPGSGFSAVTNLNRATQTASSVTEAGMGAGRTGQRIRLTSGTVNAIAWLDRDFGGGVYRTSPWGIVNTAASPLPGNPTAANAAATNTFVIESLTMIGYLTLNDLSAQFGGVLSVNGTQTLVKDVFLTQADIPVSILPLATVTNAPMFYGCRVHCPISAAMCECYIDTGVIHAAPGSTVTYFGCLCRARPTFQNGTVAFLDYDTLFSQSGSNGFRCRYGGVARIGTAAVFEAGADGVLIEDGEARCDVFLAGQDLLWGTGSGGAGIRVRSGGKVTYVTKPTVTGGSDTIVGGTAKTYATIPYVEPANNAMIVAFA